MSQDTSAARSVRGPVGATRRSALTTGLEILDRIAARGQLRVTEIAEEVSLPLSTAHRYVRQLRSTGHVYEVDGYYCLGDRLVSPGERVPNGHLVRLVEPMIRRLTEATGEASLLTVRVGTAAVCLERVMPKRRYVLSFQRGTVRPLYAGASASVLLAYAPEDIVDAVADGPHRQYTAKTPDPSTLRERLAQIREQGLALSFGEIDPQMVGIAAPAFRGDLCVCGVSVAGPSHRLTEGASLDRAVEAVLGVAGELSSRLSTVDGASAWSPDELDAELRQGSSTSLHAGEAR